MLSVEFTSGFFVAISLMYDDYIHIIIQHNTWNLYSSLLFNLGMYVCNHTHYISCWLVACLLTTSQRAHFYCVLCRRY